ncbi:MAG: hypothetical protein K6T77_02765 [candidate division WOR-3 bacterium]|nr:hypothetical protein [candidate division WOR-3 bacterium]
MTLKNLVFRRLGFGFWVTGIVFLSIIVFSECGRTSSPRWPWWTADDSIAVKNALEPWRGLLNFFYAVEDSYRLDVRVGLTYQDSSSRTGDTIYKIAHLIRAWVEPTDSVHIDFYQFGVTADTVNMTDTFCQVIYRDSMSNCRLYLEFDTIWVVGFRPDTIIDTTKTPPETTIVHRVSYVEKRGFPATQFGVKDYGWAANRWVFLRRDTIPDTLYYYIVKVSGAYASIPTTEEAPQISRVILSKPGRVDTIYFAPRQNGKGLTNLKHLDSLYQVRVNEEIQVTVVTSTPQDTIADKNRFFLTVSGRKQDITVGAQRGSGVFSFSAGDTGYQHVYIEVLPYSNLFYPGAYYKGSAWAIPVQVLSQ